jgi:serine/threonine protein phosphatase PrpC
VSKVEAQFAVRSFAVTDVGRKRKNNEDAFLRDEQLNLYVVADGMGGYDAGEVASAEAVESIYVMIRRNSAQIDAFIANPTRESARQLKRLLESAVQSACYMIFAMAEMQPERQGMGTTLSALLLAGNFGATAQVGDSRVYCVRDGAAIQLTEDHTLVNWQVREGIITPEQALTSPHRNVITRAVGNKDFVQVDTQIFQIRPGDVFLLCSDGLHGYLDDEEIPYIMGFGIEEAGRKFVELACNRGGKDNITAVIVEAYKRDGRDEEITDLTEEAELE